MPRRTESKPSHYRVVEAFFGPGIASRTYKVGDVVPADDPIVKGREALLEPWDDYLERSIAPPVSEHPTIARTSGVTHQTGAAMPHVLPPESEHSAASTFAPFQPAAGVVADDVDEKGQNPHGAPTASEATPKFAGKVPDTGGGHVGEATVELVGTAIDDTAVTAAAKEEAGKGSGEVKVADSTGKVMSNTPAQQAAKAAEKRTSSTRK